MKELLTELMNGATLYNSHRRALCITWSDCVRKLQYISLNRLENKCYIIVETEIKNNRIPQAKFEIWKMHDCLDFKSSPLVNFNALKTSKTWTFFQSFNNQFLD